MSHRIFEGIIKTWQKFNRNDSDSVGETMEYTCKHCAQTFEALPSAKRKYCSRECYLEHSFETGRMRPRQTFTCKNCGGEFTDKARDRKFCSHSCSMFWRHENVGELKRKAAERNRAASPNPGRDVL